MKYLCFRNIQILDTCFNLSEINDVTCINIFNLLFIFLISIMPARKKRAILAANMCANGSNYFIAVPVAVVATAESDLSSESD